MVLIDSSFGDDSNGGHIIKSDENHALDQICISGAVVADMTSFLTETIDNFWSITSLERVFGGWYYANHDEDDKSFP